jgi:hypothetical protein
MKSTVYSLAILAIAGIAVLSCSKEPKIEDTNKAPQSITVKVVSADGTTKTHIVDGDVPTVEWSADDKIYLFEAVDGEIKGKAESESAVISDGLAGFSTTIDWAAEGSSYQYSAVYPSNSITSYSGNYYIIMPEEQVLNGNNFSVDSDVLFSTPLDHGASRVADGEELMFSFRRLGTVVRLNLVGVATGEKIKEIKVIAPSNIAGAIVYDPVTSTVDPSSAFEAYSSDTITLYINDVEATENDVFWFRVMAESDWAVGDKFTIKVTTDQNVYNKEVTLPSVIKFKDGGLTKFGVNLASSVVPPMAVPCAWDFEDGAEDWTFIDNDGDGYNWFPYEVGSISGNNSLVSQSYASGALYPDNWAFSPAVQLTEDNYLSFWVAAYDSDWPAEHYAVYIAKNSPYGTLTVLMPETIYPGGDYAEFSEDGTWQRFVYRIPDEFANQVVSFGFRHFNCTDQLALLLDYVEITVGSPIEESTIPYAAYLGEWASNGTLYFTVSPKEEGVSYSISGFPGQGDYELEAKFENHRLVLYDQVGAADGDETNILQGLYVDEGYLEWYDFYGADPRVLLRATFDEDSNSLQITPDNAYVGYVWLTYTNQVASGYGYYTNTLPNVLEPYVPDETEYLYSEGFEEGAEGWSFFDADGDGNNWEMSNDNGVKVHTGTAVLASASYINNQGALNPDNWAFTPAVQLTQDNYLSFWVTAQDQSWAAEHYAVYITDVAPTADNLGDCTVLIAETEFPNGNPAETGANNYQRFVVKIPSSFEGKTVYVGFRHFNCTDMFRLNLDDVGISSGEPVISTKAAAAPARKASAVKVMRGKKAPMAPNPAYKSSGAYRK